MEDYTIKLCNDLCDVINGSQLPISVKYYVIKDIFNEVQAAFNMYREEVTQAMKEESSEEKQVTQEVTVPVEYTEEEIEAMKKKQ